MHLAVLWIGIGAYLWIDIGFSHGAPMVHGWVVGFLSIVVLTLRVRQRFFAPRIRHAERDAYEKTPLLRSPDCCTRGYRAITMHTIKYHSDFTHALCELFIPCTIDAALDTSRFDADCLWAWPGDGTGRISGF